MGKFKDDIYRNGGAYDRGKADSYYQRGENPHYYEGETYQSERIELTDPNSDLYVAYMKGFEDNEREGNFKNWGYFYES